MTAKKSRPEAARVCVVLRGEAPETRRRAATWHAPRWRWYGPDGPDARPRSQLRQALGETVDGLVLDLHDGFDPEALGRAHGLVRAGGALVLLVPPRWSPSPRLAVTPYGLEDVTQRFERRFDRVAAAHPDAFAPQPRPPTGPISPLLEEQSAAVARIIAHCDAPSRRALALLADRGRGKSAALGLALREVEGAVVTAPSASAVAEVARFGGELPFVEPSELLARPAPRAVFMDEAAQLPVPLLQRLVTEVDTRWVFATTTHGYEGTGRGFALRFLPWLAEQLPVEHVTLETPIRWAQDDPVERFVFDALLLDAYPSSSTGTPSPQLDVDRDRLADDDPRLRNLFGLLVQAHYRTTPSDLQRLLDAPNLHLHTLETPDAVLGVNLVAEEGGLDESQRDTLLAGGNVRGHAIPQSLVTHLQRHDAGRLRVVRSVRIATHPERRGEGLARRLVEGVHDRYDPDLFGTIFGATTELVRFRQALGYQVTRVSASRGSRTGEAAVMMLRPVSERGQRLVDDLQVELAGLLPVQLELLEADGWLVSDALRSALGDALPSPPRLTNEDMARRLTGYVDGPQTFEAVADAVEHVARRADRGALPPALRTLLEARVLERRGWREAAHRADMPLRAAMRALRRAMRMLA